MNEYLIQYYLIVREYMIESDNDEEILHSRIVHADSEMEAADKLDAYYENKSEPYYKKYYVNVEFINESIK